MCLIANCQTLELLVTPSLLSDSIQSTLTSDLTVVNGYSAWLSDYVTSAGKSLEAKLCSCGTLTMSSSHWLFALAGHHIASGHHHPSFSTSKSTVHPDGCRTCILYHILRLEQPDFRIIPANCLARTLGCHTSKCTSAACQLCSCVPTRASVSPPIYNLTFGCTTHCILPGSKGLTPVAARR